MAGSLTVTGLSAGEPAGERVLGPLSVIGKNVIGETLAIPLASGNNTINIPLESVAVLIIPPTNGEAPITVRTSLNSTDAGLPINPGPNPFMYVFPETIPTTLILHATTTTGVVTIAFI